WTPGRDHDGARLPGIADRRRGDPCVCTAAAARPVSAGIRASRPAAVRRYSRRDPRVHAAVYKRARDVRPTASRALALDAPPLARYDTAGLLRNAVSSAYLVRRAGVAERWGFASDARARLLTRAIPRPTGARHQAEYYQELVRGLGMPAGPLVAALDVPDAAR